MGMLLRRYHKKGEGVVVAPETAPADELGDGLASMSVGDLREYAQNLGYDESEVGKMTKKQLIRLLEDSY